MIDVFLTLAQHSKILLQLPSADLKRNVLHVLLLVLEFVLKPKLSDTCLRYKMMSDKHYSMFA